MQFNWIFPIESEQENFRRDIGLNKKVLTKEEKRRKKCFGDPN